MLCALGEENYVFDVGFIEVKGSSDDFSSDRRLEILGQELNLSAWRFYPTVSFVGF